jgi:hypothetical protein
MRKEMRSEKDMEYQQNSTKNHVGEGNTSCGSRGFRNLNAWSAHVLAYGRQEHVCVPHILITSGYL